MKCLELFVLSEFCEFVLKFEGPATQWGGVPAKNKR